MLKKYKEKQILNDMFSLCLPRQAECSGDLRISRTLSNEYLGVVAVADLAVCCMYTALLGKLCTHPIQASWVGVTKALFILILV